MPDEAHVSSVDALEAFRASLIVFLSKARPTLEEVSSEVLRMKMWVQNEQRNFWENQLKLRARALERAQSELFSARMSKLQDATAAQEMDLHRAQRAVHEADDKVRILKRWDRELDNRTQPLLKLVEQMHGYLSTEMAHAQVLLTEMIKSLQAYSESAPRPATKTPAPADAEAPAENPAKEPQI